MELVSLTGDLDPSILEPNDSGSGVHIVRQETVSGSRASVSERETEWQKKDALV